ncbi:hypothetical protein [Roseibium sediminicola]|uniref:Uncharacterized protein n=1 Tax=Roseibium sediminicola TaxID=2933272 RepID=A0ABT0GX89_9HYPH|nr:hypothetical protein [Roseibium sp. CAU 1639]MCK7614056.1 hypothetical protein [Roseibium sp. CAU 1639]
MAKGDVFEPVLEGIGHVLFPRHQSGLALEQFDLTWIGGFVLFGLIYTTIRQSTKLIPEGWEDERRVRLTRKLRYCRYLAAFGVVFSAVMVRFAKSL